METNQAGFRKRRMGWTALAAGVLAASSGCAAPRLESKDTASFIINFKETREKDKDGARLCPTSVDIEERWRNCGWFWTTWLFPAHDCIKVAKGSTGTIQFKPQDAGRAADWEIRFNPFTKDERLVGKGDSKPGLHLDENAPKMKYAFSVTSASCPELDPVIIVW